MDAQILEKAKTWLSNQFDAETRQAVQYMIDNDPQEVIESFYRDLEFGTGGLRGIMGVGSNRMNKYTVGMATQGLANYLRKMFDPEKGIKVAIAHDSRNNSSYFSRIAAEVLSANNIKVFLFNSLRPVPELSFTVRHLKCQSGIVITASHNPKEYNGYKVYWEDGGQLTNPHDINIINEVKSISDVGEVKFSGNEQMIESIGKEIDKVYISNICSLSLSSDIIKKQSTLKMVYTPIHGAGVELVPNALKAFGFKEVYGVEEQNEVNGNFPTVHSPNPEEPAALDMAIKKAINIDAELVMATDPDADRVGIAVKDSAGKFVLLNGNQTASLLIYYLLYRWNEKGMLKGKEYIVKTIVTTELLKKIADHFQVESFNTLTGFKYIADVIKKNEGKKRFIGGGEESYGYLMGEFVRDKDAVISCCMIAEAAAWAKEQGLSLYELLISVYLRFGMYKENLISVVKKGKSGAEEIQKMMDNFRNNPFVELDGSRIILIKDYLSSEAKNLITNKKETINLPKSNVLQFFTADNTVVTMRPSGTEPKIKFYFGVSAPLDSKEDFAVIDAKLGEKIDRIITLLGLKK